MIIQKNGAWVEETTGLPAVCIPLTARDTQSLAAQAEKALQAGADLVEWRADYFQDQSTDSLRKGAHALHQAVPALPVLFTIRTKEEGGLATCRPEEYRERLLALGGTGWIRMMDVEALKEGWECRSLIAGLRGQGICVIASSHDFEKTPSPDLLLRKLEGLKESGADIIKLAVMPHTVQDVTALMKAVRQYHSLDPDTPVIAMSMGKLGEVTRVRGEDFGSCLTFGTAGAASAPGQLPARTLRTLLEEVHQELEAYRDCTLCPRNCHINRAAGQKGVCGEGAKIRAARAALHPWEEPCLVGRKGSGTVFFSGCSLRCIYCQNRSISLAHFGKELEPEELAEIFLRLEYEGAANINLVTADHFAPGVAAAVRMARGWGLALPVVLNCSGYETVDALHRWEGIVDIYLPDDKYSDPALAERFSHAPDYPKAARAAIREMVRQTGPCRFDADGRLLSGTLVRHLVLPGHTRNSIAVVDELHEEFGDTVSLSVMRQYTPPPEGEMDLSETPELSRKVTAREYDKVVSHALEAGVVNGFFQEGDSARESFIPPFQLEGL